MENGPLDDCCGPGQVRVPSPSTPIFQDITAQKCTIAVLAGTEPRQPALQPRQVKLPATGWPGGNFIT